MDMELSSLVAAAVSTIVTAAASDAWAAVRGSARRLIAAVPGATAEQERAIEEAADRVALTTQTSDHRVDQDVAREDLEHLLRRAVLMDQAFASKLEEFTAEAQAIINGSPSANVRLEAHARDSARVYQVGQGVQHNNQND